MKNIAILPNLDKDPELVYTRETANEIMKYGKNVLLQSSLEKFNIDGAKYLSEKDIFESADLIVALGGDGTILNAAKSVTDHSVPVMGINIGHLGFLTQAEKGDKSVFDDVFSGNYTIMESMMLKVSISDKNGESESFIAFNDVVINGYP